MLTLHNISLTQLYVSNLLIFIFLIILMNNNKVK